VLLRVGEVDDRVDPVRSYVELQSQFDVRVAEVVEEASIGPAAAVRIRLATSAP
jgi:hypothetical protein